MRKPTNMPAKTIITDFFIPLTAGAGRFGASFTV